MPLSAIHEKFKVSCLPRATEVAREWRATHVISLLDPGIADEHVPRISGAEHVVARLRDQENMLETGHFPDLVVSLFETVRPAAERHDARILVHCHAGISRSTAFAYSLIAHRAGPGREAEAFDAFLSIVHKPWPNRRIVEILDRHFGRDGALLAPLDALREKHPRRIDALHRHNIRRGFFELVPCEIYNR
ncbi:dual specificity protein phosphatase family protein [Rhizobium sp. G21]|uniref:dual specificity protein phosphatase family protein n=1 Tax=Rhizobium sp. G21 TaxID=2758439 RepID=UPI00160141FB|nr:dual specificity protein phosphatase family protein [Rhizobium sp. G21]MBB1250469.1 dual specificity protein phosphatase family protein [Rhizobium sp. G21]